MTKKMLPALLAMALVAIAGALPARAEDKIRAAVGQKGFWDTLVTQLASDKGFFKKEGIEVDITWTSGGGETLQTVLTGSADVAVRLLAKTLGISLKLVSTGEAAPTLTQVMSGQLDIGWSVAPFALDKVKAGEIRIIAYGNDVPELAHQSTRAILASQDFLTK